MEARTRPVPIISRIFSGTGNMIKPRHVRGGKEGRRKEDGETAWEGDEKDRRRI